MDLAPISSAASGLTADATGMEVRAARTPEAQRKAVASQFEAILIRQFLSQSVGSIMGGDSTAQGSVYGYFLTDTLAQQMAKGGGMGLAKVLAQQLGPTGATAPAAPTKTP